MDVEDWKKQAIKEQQNFAVAFGDRIWDRFQPNEEEELWNAIAFALLGPPREDSHYPQEGSDKVHEIRDKCIRYCTTGKGIVDIGFLFVSCYRDNSLKFTLPLIRVRRGDGKTISLSTFIGHDGRVYNDWKHFLSTNTFDGFWICVPTDGLYPYFSTVNVKFYDQTQRGEVLQAFDTTFSATSIIASVGLLGGLLMSIFPPTAPLGVAVIEVSSVLGAPGAVYGAGRGVESLVDRGIHDQSISLLDPEARVCWINIIAAIMTVGSVAATKALAATAESGQLVSGTTRTLFNVYEVTNISVAGLGVLDNIAHIIEKDEVTKRDLLEFTMSILLFTHSAVNFKTANGIILAAQEKKLGAAKRSLSPQQQRVFDNILRARQEMDRPGEVREMQGNAQFIRDLRQIQDKATFFSAFQIESGLLKVNDALVIDAKAYMQMGYKEMESILNLSKDLKENRISTAQFNTELSGIARKYNLMFENQRADALARINDAFQKALGASFESLQVGERRIFQRLELREIARLNNVLREAGKDYNPQCLKVAYKIADRMHVKNVTEFTSIMEYTVRKLDTKVAGLCKDNPNPRNKPSGTKTKDFFREQVYKEFLDSNQAQGEIITEFKDIMDRCRSSNTAGTPQFGNEFAAANHYDKHKFFPKLDEHNPLSPETYFEVAREMTNGLSVISPKWTQDGTALVFTFVNREYGAMAIRFDIVADPRSVIATLYAANEPQFARLYAEN